MTAYFLDTARVSVLSLSVLVYHLHTVSVTRWRQCAEEVGKHKDCRLEEMQRGTHRRSYGTPSRDVCVLLVPSW